MDPDPYLWLMDPDSDPGGPKTHESYGPGSGSATLLTSIFYKFHFKNIFLESLLQRTSVMEVRENGERHFRLQLNSDSTCGADFTLRRKQPTV
jgi:hypothetical protein